MPVIDPPAGVRPPGRLLPLAIITLALSIPGSASFGATWYVRSDGGSAEQCTGRSNLPYGGSGSGQPCAWDHPFRALPPGGTPRIAGGDTLMIAAGSYMMGYGAPESGQCEADAAWDCFMPPVPSGPSPSSPTRIIGACGGRTELWGTERAETVINLSGSSNVEIACVEITDHSGCVEFHSGSIPCRRDSPPFGLWAVNGIYAEDSGGVTLRSLDIHGLAGVGVRAGRISDWTVTDVRIAANGAAGWDSDIGEESSNSGTMRFTRLRVEWNGCGETWPGRQPDGCWGQSAGGYGDGFGTGATQGRWIFDESSFLYNTSDGLDLLYVRPGGSVEVRRTIAAGNAGQQLKVAGPSILENVVIAGNCGWFDGKPVTFNVDNCRAAGNALAVFLYPGDSTSVVNSTIASEGDCVVFAGCHEGWTCNGTERLLMRNNILIGKLEFGETEERSASLYWEGIRDSSVDADYSIIFGTKDDSCIGAHDFCGVDPLLNNDSLENFDPRLRPGSIAIGTAERSRAPAVDFSGRLRDATPDIGAWEYGETTSAPRRRAVRRP
jgi:hypothetical protein